MAILLKASKATNLLHEGQILVGIQKHILCHCVSSIIFMPARTYSEFVSTMTNWIDPLISTVLFYYLPY